MSKQTAVEWLSERLIRMIPTINPIYKKDIDTYLQQAKEMEKEQIMEAWREGLYHHYDGEFLPKRKYKDYEDYYNKVYNQP
jgi:hypothetical protein